MTAPDVLVAGRDRRRSWPFRRPSLLTALSLLNVAVLAVGGLTAVRHHDHEDPLATLIRLPADFDVVKRTTDRSPADFVHGENDAGRRMRARFRGLGFERGYAIEAGLRSRPGVKINVSLRQFGHPEGAVAAHDTFVASPPGAGATRTTFTAGLPAGATGWRTEFEGGYSAVVMFATLRYLAVVSVEAPTLDDAHTTATELAMAQWYRVQSRATAPPDQAAPWEALPYDEIFVEPRGRYERIDDFLTGTGTIDLAGQVRRMGGDAARDERWLRGLGFHGGHDRVFGKPRGELHGTVETVLEFRDVYAAEAFVLDTVPSAEGRRRVDSTVKNALAAIDGKPDSRGRYRAYLNAWRDHAVVLVTIVSTQPIPDATELEDTAQRMIGKLESQLASQH